MAARYEADPEIVARLRDALTGGDRMAYLKAIREKLTADFIICAARDSAGIARQLAELDELIDSLDGTALQEGTSLDEFTKRLGAKRRAGA